MSHWRSRFFIKVMKMVNFLHLERLLQKTAFPSHPFIEFFPGFEKNKIVNQLFGVNTREVLRDLCVEFTWLGGYMWVNTSNRHLVISSRYLREGNRIHIYLDLIHELAHIRQLMNGKNLFDGSYSYVQRPTEIEAYRYTVQEAKLLLASRQLCSIYKNLIDYS